MERRTFFKHTAAFALSATALHDLLAANLSNPNPSNRMQNHNAYPNVSTSVKLRGQEVKIHALCTGTVAVKNNFRTKKGTGELAKLNILLDKHYTPYLPIWVWVIEHPEGLLVIDTGEAAAINDLDAFLAKESGFMRYQFRHAARFGITEKDELNYQLASIGLKPEDVKLVVLTHLHLDHTDGLKFFPKQEIMVGDLEARHPHSNMPSTYPAWFRPNRVSYQSNRIEIFDEAFPLTAAEDLLFVPTPGHTYGHSSVVFRTDEFDIIFAGDASYNQAQVLQGELAGVNADFKKSRETYKNLLSYASLRKTIYLPTHDEQAGLRLQNKEFLL